ncbi:MAG: hypothetical protein LZF62_470009 [Nitrospira sp.]|nr:MAG: hypothetical protein LZF62_470009 [Nitrospira sp.]
MPLLEGSRYAMRTRTTRPGIIFQCPSAATQTAYPSVAIGTAQWRITVHYIAGASYPLRIVPAPAPVLTNLISPASMVTPC